MNKVAEYIGHAFMSSSERTPEYKAFERQCKNELKQMCDKQGINIHKFYPNHFEWTAVLERQGKFIYVSISDVRFFNWYNRVLIRTMEHAEDWRGGTNDWCKFCDIADKAARMFERGW